MITRTLPLLALAASIVLNGCSYIRETAGQMPDNRTSSSILWKRTTAEYSAITRQTYRLAEQRLRDLQTKSLLPESWAVVLDVDETILDNSTYDMNRASRNQPWSQDSWSTWVEKREATLIPGAKDFIGLVKSMGGRVALVTNRADVNEVATVDNLKARGIAYDYLLTMKMQQSNKTERWRWLRDRKGLNIILWVGDQISDLPELKQCSHGRNTDPVDNNLKTGLSTEFGEALEYPIDKSTHRSIERCAGYYYFILPNPVYGGWSNNPWR